MEYMGTHIWAAYRRHQQQSNTHTGVQVETSTAPQLHGQRGGKGLGGRPCKGRSMCAVWAAALAMGHTTSLFS
jgi:hypothetical protein